MTSIFKHHQAHQMYVSSAASSKHPSVAPTCLYQCQRDESCSKLNPDLQSPFLP